MFGEPLRHFQACPSTNDEAMRWARIGAPHGAVVRADAQSSGRGRNGRTWNSPSGKGLYFTLIVRPTLEMSAVPQLTMLAALGAAQALDRFARGAAVKWPNDILLNSRKVGGILSEASPRSDVSSHVDWAVIGIGLNINHEADDLPPRPIYPATSLLIDSGRRQNADDVLEVVLEEIRGLYERFATGEWEAIRRQWQTRDALLGRDVEVTTLDGAWRGFASSVETDGALCVRDERGPRRVVAGDVRPLD
jgi:BirA family biotin operon repressor/biotin-[acetyl-CoA-carboxylase] ligase